MAFKIGQKVICIKDVEWYSDFDGLNYDGPKKDEILTIDFFEDPFHLGFNKYSTTEGYYYENFRPLDEDFVEEVLKMILEQSVPETV
jgi:hypothetical protein